MVGGICLARPVLRHLGCLSQKNAAVRFISGDSRKAYIALGSNLGNRIDNIEKACRHLDAAGLQVLRTSHLYETEPMYVVDQANFINGACEVKLDDALSPMELLLKLKSIEDVMGRMKLIDKGPRNIDLDILLYDDQIWESDELSIPHKAMLEREFVLRPLCDLIPDARHPRYGDVTFSGYLSRLQRDPTMSTVTALGHDVLKAMDPSRRTRIMAVLNITPDSFSDGGKYLTTPELVAHTVQKLINTGADIIDIGGQSTRPGAASVSAEQEMDRVMPVIRAVRQCFPEIDISIDTFRHEVAQEAAKNGVNIVNDISAGLLDPKMLPTVAELGCTYIAMHTRGDPNTMAQLNQYSKGVFRGVGEELVDRVQATEIAGIRRWRLVLDPGIGFAKNKHQNLTILRECAQLRQWPGLEGFPWLVGTSRKKFIGTITRVKEAHERVWGTAAAVTASVQGGADIVRVHDVDEMAQVVKMADAIWRVTDEEASQ